MVQLAEFDLLTKALYSTQPGQQSLFSARGAVCMLSCQAAGNDVHAYSRGTYCARVRGRVGVRVVGSGDYTVQGLHTSHTCRSPFSELQVILLKVGMERNCL